MYKGLVAEIAIEVGKSPALLLNQIYQWFKSKNTAKIYRTNEELKLDMNGILSTATIQRAKKKLIDCGYITVSFDKGLKRTTHFKLTDKAKKLLESANKENIASIKVAKKETKPFDKQNKSVDVDNRSKSMVEAFDNYGNNPNATKGIPDHLKQMILGKKKDKKVVAPITLTQDEHDETGLSDDDWNEIDKHCSDIAQDKDLSFNEILNLSFQQIPNIEVLENNRKLMNDSNLFKEDY